MAHGSRHGGPHGSALLTRDDYAKHVVNRLLDYFADTTPWQRRLWIPGSVLALREAWDAGVWVRRQVLSEGALRWYCRWLERVLGRDVAVGDEAPRRQLTQTLRDAPVDGTREHRRLAQLVSMIDAGYIERWLAAADSLAAPAPERVARGVAAHLLDLGFSSGYLHRWARRLSFESDATLDGLLTQAAELADRDDVTYTVLVPFRSVPDHQTLADHLPEWRPARAVRTWLQENGSDPSDRQNGGFIYDVAAKDPHAAARIAGALVDRLIARSTYTRAGRARLEPVGRVWIKGERDALQLRPPARGVDVLSLEREATMYNLSKSSRVDDALELAAPLNNGPAASAVTGGWAALEALLYHPDDARDRQEGRAIAADRLASLVACSWPRAELTTLSYRHRPTRPDLVSQKLAACNSNRQRCEVVAGALVAGTSLALSRESDQASVARMIDLLARPNHTIREIEHLVQGGLRRLYRHRNIVVHGGAPQSAALDAALRTAAPLVGAGLDRLAHAFLTEGVEPLDLAARAQTRLELLDNTSWRSLTRLLEDG